MKNLLVALTVAAGLMFTSTAAYAGCGKKVATNGEVAKYDADTKTLTIKVTSASDPNQVKSKMAQLTLTPNSKLMNGATAEGVVGEAVTVVSEHGKIDYLIPLASAR